MSLLKNTIKILTSAIENYTNIPVVNNDITENEPRPCFYIEPTSITTDFDGIQVEHEVQQIRIIYFEKNTYEGYLDLLTMKDILQKCLLGVAMEYEPGKNFFITEIEWEVYRGDMVLTADVNLELFGENYQTKEDEENPYYMEYLQYTERENF